MARAGGTPSIEKKHAIAVTGMVMMAMLAMMVVLMLMMILALMLATPMDPIPH